MIVLEFDILSHSAYGYLIVHHLRRCHHVQTIMFHHHALDHPPAQYVENYKGDSDHFIHVLEHLFKPAIEAAGLIPIPPISKGAEVIHGDIIQNLETADLVLCDMSILNPNVFFELGIRTALNKSVAMIRDNVTERVPFDTTIINYHEYNSGLEPWGLSGEIGRLTVHLKDCAAPGTENSLWGYFSMSQQAEVPSDAGESEKQFS